jgi:hypothetical protein
VLTCDCLPACFCACLPACLPTQVGTGSGHRYGRWRACLLPLTVPLLWFAADPSLVVGIGWLGLVFGCSCAAVGSGIIWATYPASDVPRKALKGVCGQTGTARRLQPQRICSGRALLLEVFEVHTLSYSCKRAASRRGNPWRLAGLLTHRLLPLLRLPRALQASLLCWPLCRPSCGST